MKDRAWYTWGYNQGNRNKDYRWAREGNPHFKKGFKAGRAAWKKKQLINLLTKGKD